MFYFDVILNEMQKCNKRVDVLIDTIPLYRDENLRVLMQLELDQEEMYKYSLNRLVGNFSNVFSNI